jgi:hypothetical protein
MAISLNRSTCKDPVNFVISILSPAFFFADARRSLSRETRLTPTDTTSLTQLSSLLSLPLPAKAAAGRHGFVRA